MGYWVDEGQSMRLVAQEEQLAAQVMHFERLRTAITTDPVLHTALGIQGLKVPEQAIASVSAAKITGTFGTGSIADDAITQEKMANDSVGSDQLIDESVGSAAIADLAIQTNHLGALQVTDAKVNDISFAKVSGNYTFANRNTGFYGAAAVAQPAVTQYDNSLAAPSDLDTQPNFSVTGVVADDINNLYDAVQRLSSRLALLNNNVVRATGLGA